MRRARERGSICLYVSVCLLSLGLLAGAIVPLATIMGTRTTRRSDELRARMAFEAGVAMVKSQSLAMRLVVGSPLTISVNGASGTLTTTANDAQLANTLLVTGIIVRNGRSYCYSRVVGARQPSPFVFAMMSKGDANFPKTLILGANGWGGDAFSDGKFTIGSAATGSTINGNLGAVGTVSAPSGTVVTGRTLTSQTTIAWPTPAAADYSSAANALILSGSGVVVLTNTALTSITFPSWSLSGAYAMWYFGGNLTLGGTISGRGTLFVKGNLTISGNLQYATPSDEIAIVVAGDVNVSSSVSTIDGYYFVAGKFNAPQTVAVSRGALVASGFGTPQAVSVVRDDAVLLNTTEAVRLRLPYYWP